VPELFTGTGPPSVKCYYFWAPQFFGITDLEIVNRAALASLLMEIHCCLQDGRLDGELPPGINLATSDALSNVLLCDSLSMFAGIAGCPEFQNNVREAFSDLAEAYAIEAADGLPSLTRWEAFRSVADRAAPYHILVSALGYHSGRAGAIESCSEAARHLVMWMQIQDDVYDWRQDLKAHRRSYLLLLLQPYMQDLPILEWKAEDVENALYLFGGAEALLEDSLRHLRAAFEIVRVHAAEVALADTPESLSRWLRVMIQTTEQRLDSSIKRKREFLRTSGFDLHRTLPSADK
jgi:hypothetical protein